MFPIGGLEVEVSGQQEREGGKIEGRFPISRFLKESKTCRTKFGGRWPESLQANGESTRKGDDEICECFRYRGLPDVVPAKVDAPVDVAPEKPVDPPTVPQLIFVNGGDGASRSVNAGWF
ncbi:hypothetical protein L2E82_50257 [Cichorium intybus]|nr:hypothetical protein L2E82_50257 [Cichorium intybus]